MASPASVDEPCGPCCPDVQRDCVTGMTCLSVLASMPSAFERSAAISAPLFLALPTIRLPSAPGQPDPRPPRLTA